MTYRELAEVDEANHFIQHMGFPYAPHRLGVKQFLCRKRKAMPA